MSHNKRRMVGYSQVYSRKEKKRKSLLSDIMLKYSPENKKIQIVNISSLSTMTQYCSFMRKYPHFPEKWINLFIIRSWIVTSFISKNVHRLKWRHTLKEWINDFVTMTTILIFKWVKWRKTVIKSKCHLWSTPNVNNLLFVNRL